jgi:hypothetical protein
MFACLSAITSAFDDGKQAPGYSVRSWYYHSCSFLSASKGNDELGELEEDTQNLVKKIDLNWVRAWMVEAVYLVGLSYLRKAKLPTKVRRVM